MAPRRFTLYHVTQRSAADAILRDGFRAGEPIELSNSPWKIGTHGDTAIRVDIDLDDGVIDHQPNAAYQFHVHLNAETLNRLARMALIGDTERDELRRRFRTPGDPTVE